MLMWSAIDKDMESFLRAVLTDLYKLIFLG